MTRQLAPVTVGVGLLAVAALVGCGPATRQFSDSHAVGTQLDEIRFIGGGGALTVRTTSGTQTTVERRVHYSDKQPGATDHVTGATLQLDMDCGRNCWVDYTVTLPKAAGLSGQLNSGSVNATGVAVAAVRTSSGDVTITDASGPVTAHSNSGAVRVRNAAGPVVAEASSGNVTVSDAKSTVTALTSSGGIDLARIAGAVSAKSSSGEIKGATLSGDRCGVRSESGNIDLNFTGTPDITAEASSGNVRVSVPAGKPYKVDVATRSGDRTVTVPVDGSAPHSLTLRTTSGDITALTH
jgi:DUF4097 and DUF4098 domain-containing protein YvlB